MIYTEPRPITDDTEVAYDLDGRTIKAENLQRWAYVQLSASFDMYKALDAIRRWLGNDCRFKQAQMVIDALAKAEGK